MCQQLGVCDRVGHRNRWQKKNIHRCWRLIHQQRSRSSHELPRQPSVCLLAHRSEPSYCWRQENDYEYRLVLSWRELYYKLAEYFYVTKRAWRRAQDGEQSCLLARCCGGQDRLLRFR